MYKRLTPKIFEKKKINDKKFKIIIEMLKYNNTLSALDIQKKLIDNGVNASVSTIRRALKMRKYSYKNKILLQLS